uniref:DUF4220 domain-containing protein n=1 Tax=Leersia perrieri TaxID=77586 RepID=A0A0D9XTX7_9ORYZ
MAVWSPGHQINCRELEACFAATQNKDLFQVVSEMRPVGNGADVGGGNLMKKQSLVVWEQAKELWGEWEIHCLVLTSLFLQVFLFLMADMRRRNASRILRTVLWLAYLLADTVAIFVLGHLAVNISGASHELMFFWAPFMLVHLGGQDTITAFSKQDNELWTRHLLSLVSQVAVAGYVVSKSSWLDGRLKAAMVLMFICGSFKYAERTYCLYSASPESLRAASIHSLSFSLGLMDMAKGVTHFNEDIRRYARVVMEERFSMMLSGTPGKTTGGMILPEDDVVTNIMSAEVPLNSVAVILAVDDLPSMLADFKNSPHQYHMAYGYVAAHLVHSYQQLYTKKPLRDTFYSILSACLRLETFDSYGVVYLISTVFQYLLAPIALVLFTAAEKDGHHSRADITVSYILLVGAIALDLVSIFVSIISYRGRKKKQWSEELAQYSMIKRHTMQDTRGMFSSIQQWIGKQFGAWGIDLLDFTPVTPNLMELVISKLLWFQSNKQEWGFASFYGEQTLRNWMESNQVPESKRSEYELNKSIGGGVDFPTTVLIWNIATDICYFFRDKGSNIEPDDIKKKMSIELSHYIMYLVFKCGVMLTSNSRFVHHKVHFEIIGILSTHVNLKEEEALHEVYGACMDREQVSRMTPNSDINVSSELQKLLQSTMEALYSPVLPRACAVAQELIQITTGEADRWNLISDMWLEMLFYIAPRCGGAFHYEHLSTGGEFITHVLLLMRLLGPFLPLPDASNAAS